MNIYAAADNLARKAWEAGAAAARYRDMKYLADRGLVEVAALLQELPLPTEEDIAEEVRAQTALVVNNVR